MAQAGDSGMVSHEDRRMGEAEWISRLEAICDRLDLLAARLGGGLVERILPGEVTYQSGYQPDEEYRRNKHTTSISEARWRSQVMKS
jgi:hypothetical protein